MKSPASGLFYAPALTCIFLKYTLGDMEATLLSNIIGFDWDHGNYFKNQQKHSVETWECEQVFFNRLIILYEDHKNSIQERRLFVLGQTDAHRRLFIVFTTRNQLIMVISARDMNKKERGIYEQAQIHAKV